MFEAEGGEASTEELERLKNEFEDCMTFSDLLLAMVTAVGEKKGSDIEAFFDDEKRIDELAGLFNSMGLNCVVDYDPGESFVKNMVDVFDLEEDLSEMLKRDIRVRMFITRDSSYDREFFRQLLDMKKREEYHRRYGDFVGLSEEDIEAFVYSQKPWWVKIIKKITGSEKPEAILENKIMEEYGDYLDEHDKAVFRAFTFGKIRDTHQGFEEALDRAKRRQNALEDYGVDTSEFIDIAED